MFLSYYLGSIAACIGYDFIYVMIMQKKLKKDGYEYSKKSFYKQQGIRRMIVDIIPGINVLRLTGELIGPFAMENDSIKAYYKENYEEFVEARKK